MGNVRVIDVHQSVYAVNDEIAAKTRARLKEEKTFMVNLMSSPGAGKTTTLIRTANMLGDRYRIGVMEADIDSSVDAEKMAAAGVTSIQVQVRIFHLLFNPHAYSLAYFRIITPVNICEYVINELCHVLILVRHCYLK